MASEERQAIWKPSDERKDNSNLTSYINFLSKTKNLQFTNYNQLHQWSVSNLADFWQSIWQFTEVVHSKNYSSALKGQDIRKAEWFADARLNFAENLLRFKNAKNAIHFYEINDNCLE